MSSSGEPTFTLNVDYYPDSLNVRPYTMPVNKKMTFGTLISRLAILVKVRANKLSFSYKGKRYSNSQTLEMAGISPNDKVTAWKNEPTKKSDSKTRASAARATS